jgi:hypothetical protein
MLCESILHLLVEEDVITKEKALDAIERVTELARETIRRGQKRAELDAAVTAVELIGASFAAKEEGDLGHSSGAGR